MATHKIQLRGISRNPSNRATADGGCSESLNVQIDNNEIIPAAEPSPANIGLPSDYTGEVLYIHKGDNYEHFIGREDGMVVWLNSSGGKVVLGEAGEGTLRFSSIGNALIYNTDDSVFYLLFNEGRYKLQGSHIPFPEINIAFRGVQEVVQAFTREYGDARAQNRPTIDSGFNINEKVTSYSEAQAESSSYKHDPFTYLNPEIWDYQGKMGYFSSGSASSIWRNEELTEVSFFRELLRSYEESVRVNNRSFSMPVFVKYSLALYDGTEIDSEPVLMCPDIDINNSHRWELDAEIMHIGQFMSTAARWLTMNLTYTTKLFKVYFGCAGNAVLRNLKEKWSDIVKGVYVYMSNDVTAEDIDTFTKFSLKETQPRREQGYHIYIDDARIKIYKDGISEEKMKSTAQFFRVGEYTLDEAIESSKTIEYINNDERSVKSLLAMNTLQSKHAYIPTKLMEYNKRLFAYGMRTVLYEGPMYLLGRTLVEQDYTIPSIMGQVYYLIKDNLGRMFTATRGEEMSFSDDYLAYLAYPHQRCYRTMVWDGLYWYAFEMTPHDFLPMSFFVSTKYSRLDKLINAVNNGEVVQGVSRMDYEQFNPNDYPSIIEDSSVLYATAPNNFYIYESSQELSAPIVGVSVNTTALSAGQYGQFPLVVFTKEGMWGIGINSEGGISGVAPLPRDVAKEGRIWQMDNATVFLTAKSLMMVTGSQVGDLAEDMIGRPYKPNDAILPILRECGYGQFVDIVSDKVVFLEFMEDAQMSYDYSGGRLLFFNNKEDYAYAYHTKTRTWHKISLPRGLSFDNVLNSYPDALVAMRGEDKNLLVKVGGIIIDEDGFDTALGDEGFSEFYNPLLDLSDGVGSSVDVSSLDDEQKETLMGICSDWGMSVGFAKVSLVYDFSTVLDADNEDADKVKGLIVTRPFDCNLPDVYKSIREIILRGDFERGNVKYILLGSNDGLNFTKLSSLRGPSWRFFRMVILTDLKPTERLSYIEIDYTARFGNKPR